MCRIIIIIERAVGTVRSTNFGQMNQWGTVISRNQAICLEVLVKHGVSVHVKREDEIHPEISGNKWRKLKYHLKAAREKKSQGILTFGGAFSNHIAATAFAADQAGLESIGVIRGERVEPLNSTLEQAERHGMELHFVSRMDYRTSKDSIAEDLDPGDMFHHVPEGGADELGIQGCQEILSEEDSKDFDIVCCSSGTGATAAGLHRSLAPHQRLRVYPALKGDFAHKDIERLLDSSCSMDALDVISEYHFGGYAKTSPELFNFMREFYSQTGIMTDPVYTAKMLYGVITDIEKGRITRGMRVVALHTGGLQGIQGIEKRDNVRIFNKDLAQ